MCYSDTKKGLGCGVCVCVRDDGMALPTETYGGGGRTLLYTPDERQDEEEEKKTRGEEAPITPASCSDMFVRLCGC